MIGTGNRVAGGAPAFLGLALAAMLAAVTTGCDQNRYCINCGSGGIDSGTADSGRVDSGGIDSGGIDSGGAGSDAMDRSDAGPCTSTDEVCDGVDNDCDGAVDEGPFAGVGQVCSVNVGECSEGITECINGQYVCTGGVLPMVERCDNRDNDCDGMIDNGNPEGGGLCGIATGECSYGTTRCVTGSLLCIGGVNPTFEVCDGLDNDCDGKFDETIAAGPVCGPAEGNTGACKLGREMCVGGQMQCTGAVYPTVEQCDGNPDTIDRDCDGDPLSGFDLAADVNNCNACGNVCADNFTVPEPHVAALQCAPAGCQIAACASNYRDIDGAYANGCEYGPCVYQGPQELCNLADDDCDGVIDEGVVVPDICSAFGACADPVPLVPTCTAGGWVCDYAASRPGVEVDASGAIVPETLCDNVDNDCDGEVDEGDPLKGLACDLGGQGVCRSTGSYQCGMDPAAPVTCVIDTPGQAPGAETCNNLDDDCDGIVDEDPDVGDLNQWVSIGGGVEIFAYEASRPDATAAAAGALQSKPCSRPGVLPWTNVTYPDAEDACAALGGGARLCTEAEWQTACEGPLPGSPIDQDPGPDGLVVLEAERFDNNLSQGNPPQSWVFDTAIPGFSGSGYMRSSPDSGVNNAAGAAATASPRLDFNVNFVSTGVHYVWVRGYAPNGSGNRVHAGIDLAIPGSADNIGNFTSAVWEWRGLDTLDNRVQVNVTSAGLHTVSIWMREDGFIIDKLLLTTNVAYTPAGLGPLLGCTWSYGAACNDYQPDTCNGSDRDSDPATAGNQDSMSMTGELATCYTNWDRAGQVYDLSGNVKEWTQARAPGVNPLRGGSYTNARGGITCGFDFTAADDRFFFPNVGFRCCR